MFLYDLEGVVLGSQEI